MTTNTTGPAELRRLAVLLSRYGGTLAVTIDLGLLANEWDTDRDERDKYRSAARVLCGAHIGVPQAECPVCRAKRAEAALAELRRRLSSKTMALQEAEESIDRLQATKKDLTAEIKGLYAARPTLPEWAELTQARSKAEAALERAELDHALLADDYKQLGGDVDQLRAALERARALIPEMVAECVQKRKYVPCGCGGDHCSYCTYSETWHKLAAALAEGGRP